MGVVDPLAGRKAAWCAAAFYAIVAGFTLYHHEPWTDEAQAWLLARDASLIELWTRLMPYEGTPGLWHTILHVLTRLGLPYGGLNILSALLGLAAAWLVMTRAPFPLAIRLILPFTFFLCYQYVIVARSYTLLPVLLFGCAILCGDPVKRLAPLTAMLCLMAAVSVHGAVLSGCIWVAIMPVLAARGGRFARRRAIVAAAAYLIVVVLVAASAWPARDGTFVSRPNLSVRHAFEVAANMLRQAFTGEWVPSLAAVGVSLPFLWRGGGLPMFGLSAVLLFSIAGIIYAQVWHQGLLLLAWLFALWISAYRVRPPRLVVGALTLVIGFQCYWTIQSIRYDAQYPYSGSLAAARYLRSAGIPQHRLYAIGYACTGIQPYFPRNVFGNVNDGRAEAYWDWSERNHVNRDSERLAVLAPEYVMVGYKGAFERDLWTDLVRKSGYRAVRHFDGNLFWRTRILEPEAFDLYRRP